MSWISPGDPGCPAIPQERASYDPDPDQSRGSETRDFGLPAAAVGRSGQWVQPGPVDRSSRTEPNRTDPVQAGRVGPSRAESSQSSQSCRAEPVEQPGSRSAGPVQPSRSCRAEPVLSGRARRAAGQPGIQSTGRRQVGLKYLA